MNRVLYKAPEGTLLYTRRADFSWSGLTAKHCKCEFEFTSDQVIDYNSVPDIESRETVWIKLPYEKEEVAIVGINQRLFKNFATVSIE